MELTTTVIGFRRGGYTNKSGNYVRYSRIFTARPMKDYGAVDTIVCGSSCEVLYIPRDIDVNVGDEIIPVYNKYGSCVDIIIRMKGDLK